MVRIGTIRSALDAVQPFHILLDLLHHQPLLASHGFDLFRATVDIFSKPAKSSPSKCIT